MATLTFDNGQRSERTFRMSSETTIKVGSSHLLLHFDQKLQLRFHRRDEWRGCVEACASTNPAELDRIVHSTAFLEVHKDFHVDQHLDGHDNQRSDEEGGDGTEVRRISTKEGGGEGEAPFYRASQSRVPQASTGREEETHCGEPAKEKSHSREVRCHQDAVLFSWIPGTQNGRM